MRFICISLALIAIIGLSGCGTYWAPVMPPMGSVFESTKAPLDTNVEKTELGTKTGESGAVSILTLFAFGDCSIHAAARNGNIEEITHADYSYTNILGIYQNFTTIAYGY